MEKTQAKINMTEIEEHTTRATAAATLTATLELKPQGQDRTTADSTMTEKTTTSEEWNKPRRKQIGTTAAGTRMQPITLNRLDKTQGRNLMPIMYSSCIGSFRRPYQRASVLMMALYL